MDFHSASCCGVLISTMNSSAGDMCVRMCKAVALREAFEPRASFEPRMPPRASDPQRLLQFYHHLRGCCRQHAAVQTGDNMAYRVYIAHSHVKSTG
eukprot:COSAG02_NODE_348_length_24081_cov_19.231007_13_plen_96_part_00